MMQNDTTNWSVYNSIVQLWNLQLEWKLKEHPKFLSSLHFFTKISTTVISSAPSIPVRKKKRKWVMSDEILFFHKKISTIIISSAPSIPVKKKKRKWVMKSVWVQSLCCLEWRPLDCYHGTISMVAKNHCWLCYSVMYLKKAETFLLEGKDIATLIKSKNHEHRCKELYDIQAFEAAAKGINDSKRQSWHTLASCLDISKSTLHILEKTVLLDTQMQSN